MYITKLHLRQFRNYNELILDFNHLGNIIIGKNAQGKTNIIESIYVAAYGKSFRAKKDTEIIKFNADFYNVKMSYVHQQEDNQIALACLSDGKRQVKINGLAITKSIDLIGVVRVVIFSQEDLKVLRGTPQDRRSQIDRLFSTIDANYKATLSKYFKILKHRNSLLKKITLRSGSNDELEYWNNGLSKLGARIIYDRISYLKKLSELIVDNHDRISSSNEKVSITYESSLKNLSGMSLEQIEKQLSIDISKSLDKDLRLRYTSVGPHRDDISYIINDYDARKFASQGQQRTLVISQKLAEIHLIQSIFDDYPIFLLDDVMSELDIDRQHELLMLIKDCQTIMTTTDLNGINMSVLNNCKIFEIENGALKNFGGKDE